MRFANFAFLQLWDQNYLKPFFTRLRPRTRVDEAPDNLDIEEFELLESANWRGQATESTENAVELSSNISTRSLDTETTSDEDVQTAVFDDSI